MAGQCTPNSFIAAVPAEGAAARSAASSSEPRMGVIEGDPSESAERRRLLRPGHCLILWAPGPAHGLCPGSSAPILIPRGAVPVTPGTVRPPRPRHGSRSSSRHNLRAPGSGLMPRIGRSLRMGSAFQPGILAQPLTQTRCSTRTSQIRRLRNRRRVEGCIARAVG